MKQKHYCSGNLINSCIWIQIETYIGCSAHLMSSDPTEHSKDGSQKGLKRRSKVWLRAQLKQLSPPTHPADLLLRGEQQQVHQTSHKFSGTRRKSGKKREKGWPKSMLICMEVNLPPLVLYAGQSDADFMLDLLKKTRDGSEEEVKELGSVYDFPSSISMWMHLTWRPTSRLQWFLEGVIAGGGALLYMT